MRMFSIKPAALLLCSALTLPAFAAADAQELPAPPPAGEGQIDVYGQAPDDLTGLSEGPEIEGFISARKGDKVQVTTPGGTRTVVLLSDGTQIRGTGGFLGLSRDKLAQDSLLNGLPVSVETVQWAGNLVASKVALKSKDLKLAAMIHNGTEQGFAEQTAATDALRSRVADIDNYLIKGTTNVNFDTGKALISDQAKAELCAVADRAKATDNAILLVVGYTDSTGSWEVNQDLSEKRAGRVTAFLQQRCGWSPQRMLTPAGMATSDPLADNSTEYGKAQNRRVAVNILVSKAVDGIDAL